MIQVRPIDFLSAEPGILPTADNAKMVILSFGGEEGPIEDRAITVPDAMELVKQVIASLVTHGVREIA